MELQRCVLISFVLAGCAPSAPDQETPSLQAYEAFLQSRIHPGDSLSHAVAEVAFLGFSPSVLTMTTVYAESDQLPAAESISPRPPGAITSQMLIVVGDYTRSGSEEIPTNWCPVIICTNSVVKEVNMATSGDERPMPATQTSR